MGSTTLGICIYARPDPIMYEPHIYEVPATISDGMTLKRVQNGFICIHVVLQDLYSRFGVLWDPLGVNIDKSVARPHDPSLTTTYMAYLV